jgi:hypothetical protein
MHWSKWRKARFLKAKRRRECLAPQTKIDSAGLDFLSPVVASRKLHKT